MVVGKSLPGALWVAMVVCTQAGHNSMQNERQRNEGFLGCKQANSVERHRGFPDKDQTLRDSEYGER